MEIWNFVFIKPYFLLLLPLIAVVIYFLFRWKKLWEYFEFFDDLKWVYKRSSQIFYIKIVLIVLILTNFVLLLADPNITNTKSEISKNWIDIVLALDVSASMQVPDLNPNRMQAAKFVISKFIEKLETDRVGLVVFAGKPFTSVPLTFDYGILTEIINTISSDTISNMDGTAIGDAILSAVGNIEELRNGEMEKWNYVSWNYKIDNREKVIILATDGEANLGVDPLVATKIAKKKWIKIYTIGIGSASGWYIQYQDFFGTRKQWVNWVDEKTLKSIAEMTNWKYFNALDNDSFVKTFDEISRLEKKEIKIESQKQYSEFYQLFWIVWLCLLLLFFVLNIFYNERN